MNFFSLMHLVIQKKIKSAMQHAMKKRNWAHVINSKGRACIAVHYLTGEKAWSMLGSVSGFLFLDKKGNDITNVVLQSLRASNI